MGDGRSLSSKTHYSGTTVGVARSIEEDESLDEVGNAGEDGSGEQADSSGESGKIDEVGTTADDAFGAEVESMFSKFSLACEKMANNSLQGLPGLELCELPSFAQIKTNLLGSSTPSTFEAKAPEKSRIKPAADQKPAPCLEIDKFAERAKQLFSGIDTDNDGILSTAELASAVEDHQFQGQDAQIVAALYYKRDGLKNLSDDHWFETGVTVPDLAQFASILPNQMGNLQESRDSNEWLAADQTFKAVDTNGNGFLSKEELTTALQKSDQSTRLPEFFAKMISKFDTIQAQSDDEFWIDNDGITRNDLDAHAKKIVANDEFKLIGEVAGVLSRTSDSQQGGATYELFGGKKPADSISPDAIKQGLNGDCSFLSALASVAKSNSALIEKMIHDNKDGTYTVTFPGADDKPITIDAPTQAEAGLYNGVGQAGIWPLVLEKAFGKFCRDGASPRYPSLARGVGNTHIEAGGNGADLCSPLQLLTGNHSLALTTMFSWRSHLRKELEDAFTSSPPRAVTAGTSRVTSSEGKSGSTVDGFPTGHAYSIIGFDPDGPGGGTVTIRNPWGGSKDSTSGTIKITFDQFRKNFTDLAIEQRK